MTLRMRRRPLAAIMAGLGLWMIGCGDEPGHDFRPTVEQQHAVFLTRPEDGSGGDPVFLMTDGRPRDVRVNGRPVLLLAEAQRAVRKHAGPKPEGEVGLTKRVEAVVHLEPVSVKVATDPPSTRRVYSVVIDRLFDASW